MITAKTIASSVNLKGVVLTTLQLTYPRFVHAEFMTHRVFSRNASSSRAIPVSKMLHQVRTDPAMPIHWGKNQPGMQAQEELDPIAILHVKDLWRKAADSACKWAELMEKEGAHKQIVNRILEPFQFIHVIVTSTEWDNFFELREHPDAQPEMKELAHQMKIAITNNTPKLLKKGEWHAPYVSDEELNKYSMADCLKFSTARCARVSYLTHDGSAPIPTKDIDLHNKLVGGVPIHASPCEHQARPMLVNRFYRNFRGWSPYRIEVEKQLKEADDNSKHNKKDQ